MSVTPRHTEADVVVDPSQDIQSQVDRAGQGGTVRFESGEYPVNSTVSPLSGQTWRMGESTVFVPQGDITVLDFTGVTFGNFEAFKIHDKNQNTTTTEAVYLDNTYGCYFERIQIEDCYDGLKTDSVNGDVNENIIDSLYVHKVRNRGVQFWGSTHDNHINTMWLEGHSTVTDDSGLVINTGNVDGGNIIDKILAIHFDYDGIQIASLNREIWFGQVIADSNGQHGVNCYVQSRAVFIDTLWASGNTSLGVRLSGSSSSPLQHWQVGQLYAIGNGAQGLGMEYVERSQFGQVHVRNNGDGIRFQVGTSNDVYIGNLHATGNDSATSDYDIDAGYAGVNCRIGSLVGGSPKTTGLTNMTVGGLAEESANAETPTAANYRVGDTVNFTDTGDGSGNGIYIKDHTGSMTQIA